MLIPTDAKVVRTFTIPRPEGPTSRALCRACDLPHTDLLCSHFVHVGIKGLRNSVEAYKRDFVEALCDRGEQERLNSAWVQCVAGGNPCWQRRVEIEDLDFALEVAGLPAEFTVARPSPTGPMIFV